MSDKVKAIEEINENWRNVYNYSDMYDDYDVMLAACKGEIHMFQFANYKLRGDVKFVKAVIEQSYKQEWAIWGSLRVQGLSDELTKLGYNGILNS